MLIVVTGQPRHGKTQYSIKMLLGLIKANDKREKEGKTARDIYCDIAGINAPDTPTQLPMVQNQWKAFEDKPLWFGEHDDPDIPEGFICPPRGAVFIYDECHKVDWIKDTSGALSKNPTTISMNEHGHEDYIFILITQFPQYIHTHLRGLVEDHYHVKRFNGLKSATVYKWNEFKASPRSKMALSDAYEKERFAFNKKYYNCYKSASAHDSMKFTLPKEWAMAIALVVVLLGAMIWRYNNSPVKQMVETGNADIIEANKQQQTQNPFENNLQSVPLERSEQQEIDDLKDKYLPAHIVELTKSDEILPTSVIAMGTKCVAYNRYGEALSVRRETCYKMLEVGQMPKSREDLQEGTEDEKEVNGVSVKRVKPLKLNMGG